MLDTPSSHLPPGYPLTSDNAKGDYAPVWNYAFELHKNHLYWAPAPIWNVGPEGQIKLDGPRKGIINPITGTLHYCDCYERAYRKIILGQGANQDTFREHLLKVCLVEL